MTKISSRNRFARFLLHDADIQAITACTTSIKAVYDKLEVRSYSIPGLNLTNSVKQVKLAINNNQAIARLEDQLTALLCKSGVSVRPLPRITGTFPDPCGSGNVNVGCQLFFVKSHRKTDSHPLLRVNPRVIDGPWTQGAWRCWSPEHGLLQCYNVHNMHTFKHTILYLYSASTFCWHGVRQL